MVKRPTSKNQLGSKLSALKTTDVVALSRLSAIETTEAEFGDVFAENPATALAAKGILISDAQATKISASLAEMAGGRGVAAAGEVEVGVSVKVKF